MLCAGILALSFAGAAQASSDEPVIGGVVALDDVRFEVGRGEVVCLAGENGCGKSALIEVISGVHAPEPGATMLFDGASIEGLNPARARALGIQVIWQDLALFPAIERRR